MGCCSRLLVYLLKLGMGDKKFKFHRVVVIESLEDFEVKTGYENGRLLAGEIEGKNIAVPVEYYACETAVGFMGLISDLVKQTSIENVPLLHIECHGDVEEGLVFANGSVISWPDLANLIYPLNLLTACGLMLCLSACHAGHFLVQMGNLKVPCPCRILVAPESELDPADCIRGFRIFYSELFSTMRVESALRKISSSKENGVRWVGEYSENWFKEVITEYISTHYSKETIGAEVLRMQKELEKVGVYKKIGLVKSELQQYLRSYGLRSMYEKFFGINLVPEVDKYFSSDYRNMLVWVQKMREAGRLGF